MVMAEMVMVVAKTAQKLAVNEDDDDNWWVERKMVG